MAEITLTAPKDIGHAMETIQVSVWTVLFLKVRYVMLAMDFSTNKSSAKNFTERSILSRLHVFSACQDYSAVGQCDDSSDVKICETVCHQNDPHLFRYVVHEHKWLTQIIQI